MVRIPSLSRRTSAPTRDENRDGRIDERDAQLAGDDERDTRLTDDERDSTEPAVADRNTEPTTYRSRTATVPDNDGRTATAPGPHRTGAGVAPVRETDRDATAIRDADRDATAVRDADRDATVVPDPEGHTEPPTVVAPAGPRPRASLLASLSLIIGLAAVLFVLAGALAGYGIALGVLGVLFAFGGLAATRRRHIAGRGDALFGLALALGAVLLGVLAFSGQYDWPSTDADLVSRFREWLDSQFLGRF